MSRKNDGAALSKAYTRDSGNLAPATKNNLVAVRQEGTGFASGKQNGLCSIAGEFEQTACRCFGWA